MGGQHLRPGSKGNDIVCTFEKWLEQGEYREEGSTTVRQPVAMSPVRGGLDKRECSPECQRENPGVGGGE